VIGEIDAAAGQPAAAEANFLQAIDLLQNIGDDFRLSCAQLALAKLYDGQGQYQQRDELLNQCRPVLERLGAAMELRQVQLLAQATTA
jgi:hypothetical protein